MRRLPAAILALCAVALLAAAAGAQDANTPTTLPIMVMPATATAPAGGITPPAVNDVFRVIDKATGAKDGKANEWSSPIRLAVVFTVLGLLPSLLVMVTSFTRIVIVLAFIRRALTTQSIPPTVAIVGLALFLTLFTMGPTFSIMNTEAIQPYLLDQMTFEEACTRSSETLKGFMLRQTRKDDLALFAAQAAGSAKTVEELPIYVVIPAFAISEFRTAFEMGCLLFIPFLLVDLVISGILLSAGMMMLPPSMISLPFKIILFVLVDGWRLVASSLIGSFH